MSDLSDAPLNSPSSIPVPPRRPNRKRPTLLRVLMIGMLVVFAALAGMAGYFYRSRFGQKYFVTLIGHPTVQHAFPGQSAVNMMIIGRDYDYSNHDQIIKSHARSDLLMVARIDFAANTVRILSIPRDTRALVPGHGVTKINAAHAFGGPELSEKTVASEFSIPSDYYAALDFSGFEQAIDLLGGVNLTVDKKMDYDDNWGHLHIHLNPGYQHLDGQQAIGFVRFRHSDSDLVRTHRQQALLSALKLKMLDPRTFVVLPRLMDTLDAHLDSDMNVDQKVALAYFLKDVPKSQIAMTTTLPSIEGGYYVEPDWPKDKPLISKWFGVDPPMASAFPRHRRRPSPGRRISH